MRRKKAEKEATTLAVATVPGSTLLKVLSVSENDLGIKAGGIVKLEFAHGLLQKGWNVAFNPKK